MLSFEDISIVRDSKRDGPHVRRHRLMAYVQELNAPSLTIYCDITCPVYHDGIYLIRITASAPSYTRNSRILIFRGSYGRFERPRADTSCHAPEEPMIVTARHEYTSVSNSEQNLLMPRRTDPPGHSPLRQNRFYGQIGRAHV